MRTPPAVAVRPAVWPQDLPVAARLLRAYAAFLASNAAGIVGVDVAAFEHLLHSLPTVYNGKDAVLLLGTCGDAAAGCVAVHRLAQPEESCEVKRLWAEPGFRGCGVGRALMDAAKDWAVSRGAGSLLLDTVEAAMPHAAGLYRSLGFEPVARYNTNPVAGLTFMRLSLR